jgi:hypothetical protein
VASGRTVRWPLRLWNGAVEELNIGAGYEALQSASGLEGHRGESMYLTGYPCPSASDRMIAAGGAICLLLRGHIAKDDLADHASIIGKL